MARVKNKFSQNTFLRALAIIILFIVLTIFLTRPLLFKGSNHLVGHATCTDKFDPRFHAWTVAWDIHALRNPLNLFEANIFYPVHHSLAYSEHQITNGILGVPFWLLTGGNPVHTLNLVLLLNFLISAIGGYLLCFHLSRNRFAAVVCGTSFAFAPYMFSHVTQLSICSVGWVPLSLLFLHKYCEERHVYDAFLFGLFLAVQILANTYIGIFFSVALIIFFVVRLFTLRDIFALRTLIWIIVSILLAGVIVLPFALPYLKVRSENHKAERTISEVDMHSADLQDFLAASQYNWLWGNVTEHFRKNTKSRGGPNHRTLFPGLVIFALAIIGAISLWGKRKSEERFSLFYYCILAIASAIFCLGTSLYFFGNRISMPMPYDVLYRIYPGIKALRVPSIFNVFVALS
ncbi:MAG: hypothetical protein PHP64_03210, partial [Actinomycetota bacterium]|nr:hypothetical protein [Actinomycetota bacterium]